MNKKLQKNKACPQCYKHSFCRRGMSYVELIVVLGIFSALSSVVLFNYGDFQDRVDIKNSASDIALKIVEAQKSSINGVLPPSGHIPIDDWKPSYGVYFDPSKPKEFIYFADLDNLNNYDISSSELLETILIPKNNSISRIDICNDATCTLPSAIDAPLAIIFSRLNSSAVFVGEVVAGSEYVQIKIFSPKEAKAYIKIYPSGRVQVN